MVLSVVYDMLGETALAAAGLEKLENAFAKFANNTQDFPLVYDSKPPLPLDLHTFLWSMLISPRRLGRRRLLRFL